MDDENFYKRNHALKFDNDESTNLCTSIRLYLSKKFGIWDIWDVLPGSFKFHWFDRIRPIFVDQNKRVRKSIPRTWCDISHLIEIVNFEFIKTFYEEEYIDGNVDWDATVYHRTFADWLEEAYKYITIDRPKLEKDLKNAYPPLRPASEMFQPIRDENGNFKMYKLVDDGLTYEERYGEVDRIEALIESRDTEILSGFVKNRGYFWT